MLAGEAGQPDDLNPLPVAQFLHALTTAKASELPDVVAEGLASFGIKRTATRGRPRKDIPNSKYQSTYEAFKEIADRIWAARRESQRKSQRSWKALLRQELQKQGRSTQFIELAFTATTSRILAIHLVADHLHVEYEAADRGIRRAMK